MNYETFANKVKDNIFDYMAKYGITEDSHNLEIRKVHKNNLNLTGMSFSPKTGSYAAMPTIYIEQLYDYYQEVNDFDEVAKNIAFQMSKALNERPSFSNIEDKINDFNNLKNDVFPCICNTAKNINALNDRPHQNIGDLSVYYKVFLGKDSNGTYTFTIDNSHIKLWGIDPNELHKIAFDNNRTKYECKSIIQTLIEDGYPREFLPDDDFLTVASTKDKTNGAVLIADPKYMDTLKEQYGDFYIIPSSVHEVILIPKDIANTDIECVKHMISEVNRSEVSEAEYLSDNLYEYDFETHTLEIVNFDKDLGEDLD